ncbi:MAG: hypothetical protein KDD10_30310, partial [Phaeodactylibacter sp.]|nr:hypothetical protein [Phaeodactylibacter sp.]
GDADGTFLFLGVGGKGQYKAGQHDDCVFHDSKDFKQIIKFVLFFVPVPGKGYPKWMGFF